VRRLLAWTAGVVGIAALGRELARRSVRQRRPSAPAGPAVDERAEALRRKLSQTRAADDAPDSSSAGTEAAAPHEQAASGEPTETIDERRARVHAKAQEAIAAMQEPLE
jgi:hypothetical protein